MKVFSKKSHIYMEESFFTKFMLYPFMKKTPDFSKKLKKETTDDCQIFRR